ncbi:HEAT repeat domain-containing protein [Streptomyces sp. NPDC032472]|uniref:HEAT repeat domain-containing protein n=1 Tax=Streptomyces sp. NPDC032472 TaxID=3155018 RepID=UPI00340AD38E
MRAEAWGRNAALELLLGGATPVRPIPPYTGMHAWLTFEAYARKVRGATVRNRAGAPVELRLCHPDGRVREAALLSLRPRLPGRMAAPTSLPLPLVVIRCADWVPAVRAKARRLLVESVAVDARYTVFTALPLVIRLAGREQGGWAVELFEAALHLREPRLAQWWRVGLLTGRPTRREADEMLTWLRRFDDVPTRRFAARITLARTRGAMSVPDMAREAAAEHDAVTAGMWTDAVTRALAAGRAGGRWAGAGRQDAAQREVTEVLLGGRLPAVRAAGLTALQDAGRAEEVVRYLADRSAQVRACARRLVDRAGGDPREHYRRLVTDPAEPSPYAVSGLAECGDPADLPLLRDLLEHPTGRVRAAAVAGLRRLDPAPEDTKLLALLDDPAPSVAREARRTLRPVVDRLDPAALSALCSTSHRRHTRRAAFRLLRIQNGPATLQTARTLAEDGDPGLRWAASMVLWAAEEAEREGEGEGE